MFCCCLVQVQINRYMLGSPPPWMGQVSQGHALHDSSGVGHNDPSGSPPTQDILWFYMKAFHGEPPKKFHYWDLHSNASNLVTCLWLKEGASITRISWSCKSPWGLGLGLKNKVEAGEGNFWNRKEWGINRLFEVSLHQSVHLGLDRWLLTHYIYFPTQFSRAFQCRKTR